MHLVRLQSREKVKEEYITCSHLDIISLRLCRLFGEGLAIDLLHYVGQHQLVYNRDGLHVGNYYYCC